MNSIADGSVIVQTSADSLPCPPPWWGELVLLSQHLRKQGILSRLTEGIRFERRRFGHYELIDFLVVLFGYAVSSEHTLEGFYEAVQPWAHPFMALFGRDRLPSRSALSRALAALTAPVIETLRLLFLNDLLARPVGAKAEIAGLWDREAQQWRVFDIDGTREAARQRALPHADSLPSSQRRLDSVCAPGYTGRKRGEVVRTRTTVLQAHSQQWLGSFGNKGNGVYRQELRQGLKAIEAYLKAHQFPALRALVRLDGAYGTGAVLKEMAGYAFVTRGKDYTVLDHPLIQARLHLPASWRAMSPRKPDQAPPLRLPERAGGTRWRALSRCGGDSSCGQNKESGGAHTPGHGLRTLLYQLAPAEFHCLRCGGAVFASWGLRANSRRRRQRA